MQTFLPYKSFADSARVLDNKRLGKQRVEAKQIIKALAGETKGWVNHPAVKMWRGCEGTLCDYAISICDEWISRGYKDTLRDWFITERKKHQDKNPAWLGDQGFHASHRSNLLRKAHDWYSKFGWSEGPDLPYVWPGRTLEPACVRIKT